MSLRKAWEEHADSWVAWATAPDHDSYWRFHRDAFLPLVPPPHPARPTLDLGCGEGRVGRDLARMGHEVLAVDVAATMAYAARHHDEKPLPVARADGARLPFPEAAFGVAVAFMTLHDMDDPTGAVVEMARVLAPGGRAAVAVVHPLNSAGLIAGDRPVTSGPYLTSHRYRMPVDRSGRSMTFVSDHHSLEGYSRMIEAAGLLIDAIREPPYLDSESRWSALPYFLHLRVRKPPVDSCV